MCRRTRFASTVATMTSTVGDSSDPLAPLAGAAVSVNLAVHVHVLESAVPEKKAFAHTRGGVRSDADRGCTGRPRSFQIAESIYQPLAFLTAISHTLGLCVGEERQQSETGTSFSDDCSIHSTDSDR